MGREYEDEKMSSLIFQSSYIVIIPSYYKTDIHKHPFLHLFAGKKDAELQWVKKIYGEILFCLTQESGMQLKQETIVLFLC